MPPDISQALTDEQREMLAVMNHTRAERDAGWEVEIVSKFPNVTLETVPVILGSFSWTYPTEKRKLIYKPHAYNIGGGWVSPGDIARDYLACKYPHRRKRMTTNQYNASIRHKPQPPLYCLPTEFDHAYYYDVVSAYWQIIRAVGWDVNYLPSRFLCVQSDNRDFPAQEIKLARNCLVSSGLSGSLRLWTGSALVIQRKPNAFANALLWRVVCDVLNGLAADVIRAGAVYCYTDGFIVPAHRTREVEEAFASWGIAWKIKHEGGGNCRAPASYEIGGFKTKVRRRSKPIHFDKVYNPDNDWLRWRFRTFAERRN